MVKWIVNDDDMCGELVKTEGGEAVVTATGWECESNLNKKYIPLLEHVPEMFRLLKAIDDFWQEGWKNNKHTPLAPGAWITGEEDVTEIANLVHSVVSAIEGK